MRLKHDCLLSSLCASRPMCRHQVASGRSAKLLGWVHSRARRQDTALDTVICQPCVVTCWQCTCMVSVHEQQCYVPASCSEVQQDIPTPCLHGQSVTSHLYYQYLNLVQKELLPSYGLTGSTTCLSAGTTQSNASIWDVHLKVDLTLSFCCCSCSSKSSDASALSRKGSPDCTAASALPILAASSYSFCFCLGVTS